MNDYGYNDTYYNEAKDRLSYLEAVKATVITGYEKYVADYPKGFYYSKAIAVIESSYARFANDYKSEFNKNIANASKAFNDAEFYYNKYMEKFPNGSLIKEVKDSLADMYFDKGAYQFQFTKSHASLSTAKEMFNKSIKVSPNSANRNDINSKLNIIDRKLTSLSRSDRSFLQWYADADAPLGVAFGNINNPGVGYYFAYKMNPELFTGTTYYTWDGFTYSGNAYTDLRPTGESRTGNMSISLGPTVKVVWPIWLYAGIGYRSNKEMDQISEYNSLGEFVETEWVKNTAQSKDGIEFNIGTIIDFDGFNINIAYSTMSFEENFISFGVGFSWDR